MNRTLRQIGSNGGNRHVICFPYAGGGSDAYLGLRELLPPKVDLWAVDLPGRLRRAGEPPALEFTDAISELSRAIADRFKGEPLVFYGHSMGGYLAVETARGLERLGLRPVEHVMLGACASPDQVDFSRFHELAHADDATLLEVVKGWGVPIPAGLFSSPVAAAVALRGLRLDLALLSTYEVGPFSRMVAPMSALCGATDRDAQLQKCLGWSYYTEAWNGVTELEGGHLFIATQPGHVAEELVAVLDTRRLGHD